MTVLEAIQKSTDYLARKGVDSPRLSSELLLAHLLKMQRLRLYLDFERTLPEAQVASLREMVKRRGEREPLQHILGSACFCGLEIRVNRDVLIPRPETEQLAEAGWKFLQTLDGGPFFLDFGTGSGCLAAALAHHCPEARGIGIDISPAAAEIARGNLRALQFGQRVEIAVTRSFDEIRGKLPETGTDLLISNPPYIPTGEIPQLQEEVRRFDPRTALDGGADGLDFYRLLAAEAPALLSARGKLMAEFGDGQETAIQSLFEAQNWIVEQILPDYTSRPRIFSARPRAA